MEPFDDDLNMDYSRVDLSCSKLVDLEDEVEEQLGDTIRRMCFVGNGYSKRLCNAGMLKSSLNLKIWIREVYTPTMERDEDDLSKDCFCVDLCCFKTDDLVDDIDEQPGDVKCRTCLVGMIYAEHFSNATMFKSTLNQVWNINGAIRVIDIKHNLFMVGFEYEEGCEKFVKSCPWSIANALRLLWFWIQLHELPLDFLEGRKMRKICQVLADMAQGAEGGAAISFLHKPEK